MNYLIYALIPLILIFAYLISRPRRVPRFVMDFAGVVNFVLDEKAQEILKYSQFFKQHPQAQILYIFSGKNEGKESYFGSFFDQGNIYYFLLRKEEIHPLIITDTKEKFELGNQLELEAPGKWLIYAKDKYLLENATKSQDFLLSLKDLFLGNNNYLEFTDLNQVILISDYQFSDSTQLVNWLSQFSQLKKKM